MSAIVIDTNVLLVADGQGTHMSDGCRLVCENRLQMVMAQEQTVIDDKWLVLHEYQNKLDPKRQTTPGAAFVKWILQRLGMAQHVSMIAITPTNADCTKFEEFPDDPILEADFDPADRKFIAIVNAHPERPPVLQSADSKWLHWERSLERHNIRLEVLCRDELQLISERKMK